MLMVIFVTIMCIWLTLVTMRMYQKPGPDPLAAGVGALLPWACVAILGAVVFNNSATVYHDHHAQAQTVKAAAHK